MEDREGLRVLRLLASGDGKVARGAVDAKLLVETAHGAVSISRGALARLAANDLLSQRDGRIALSAAGRSHLRRAAAGRDGVQAQHRSLSPLAGDGADDAPVMVNDLESPLRALATRRDKAGRCYLEQREFDAGERLRADFTRGQLMPRMGANWEAAVSSGRRDGGQGVGDLTDSAMGARQRVNRALDTVGPELAGILVDICCFLKGLETVERERGWPVRSAKVVLKTALAALARHYWPQPGKDGHVRHWGTADFRPEQFGGTGQSSG